MVIAAFFDFDGTLYTGHIWQDLVRHHWKARSYRHLAVAYLVRNMAPLPLYRAGLLSQERYFRTWGETMSWLVRGWTVQDGLALFEQLTDVLVLPNLRADVLSHLGRHLEQGHWVALVSGTFAPWLEVVARRLDLDHAVGTPLQTGNGRFTGRIVPPLCQGGDKLVRVRAYLAEQGQEVDWAASYAYADRGSDLPLLSAVGHPTAVYPDEALRQHAQALGWPVIDGGAS